MRSKLLVLGMAFCLLFLNSCSDEEITNVDGTFTIVRVLQSDCSDPNLEIELALDEDGCTIIDDEEVCPSDRSITLDNGLFEFSYAYTIDGVSATNSGNGTYSIADNQITICDGDDCESGTIEDDGARITIIFINTDMGCTITLTGEK